MERVSVTVSSESYRGARNLRLKQFLVALIVAVLVFAVLWELSQLTLRQKLTEQALHSYTVKMRIEDRENPVERIRIQWVAHALARCMSKQPAQVTQAAHASGERLCADGILERVAVNSPALAYAFASELSNAGVDLSPDWRGAGSTVDALRSQNALLAVGM